MKLSPEACVQVASVAMGGALAFCGTAATPFIPAGVGAVALGGLWLNFKTKTGADSERVYKKFLKIAEEDWTKNYQGLGASFDLKTASKLLEKALPEIRLTPKDVGKTTVLAGGFPEAATDLIFGKLQDWCAAQEPPERLFEVSEAAEPFVKSVFRSVFTAAIDERTYFEKVEPHILIEVARLVGEIDEKFDQLPEKLANELEERGLARKTNDHVIIEALTNEIERLKDALKDALTAGQVDEIAQGVLNLGYDDIHDAWAQIVALAQRAASREESDVKTGDNLQDFIRDALNEIKAEKSFTERLKTGDSVRAEIARRREVMQAAMDELDQGEVAVIDQNIETAYSLSLVDRVAQAEWEKIKLTMPEADRTGVLFARQTYYYSEQGEQMGGQLDLRIALALCEIGLADAKTPEHRAGHFNHKGIVLRLQGERLGGEAGLLKLEEALDCFDAALTVRTKEGAPTEWATTQQNKANVLLIQGTRLEGKAAFLKLDEALFYYDAALTVFTQERAPEKWAMTQQNMANVFRFQGERMEGEAGLLKLIDALDCFNKALTFYTEDSTPTPWAATQLNMSAVFHLLADRMRGDKGQAELDKALACCHAALRVYTKERWPNDWALTQHNKAVVLELQGQLLEGEAGFAKLTKALSCYDAALTVYTKESAPARWAMTKENIAILFMTRFELTSDPADLDAAERAATEAMSVYGQGGMEYDAETCQAKLDGIAAVKSQL